MILQMNHWNPYQSSAYQQEVLRRRTIDLLSTEFYVFLSTFYGNYIEDGTKRIKDYRDMTFFDVTSELRLRVQMIRAMNNNKVKHHFEEDRKKQIELLEKLKKLTN